MDLSCFNWIQLIKKSDLPSNAKLISFYLATFMNLEHDIAWPAQSRISRETGLTEPTVRKYLKILEENDWLIIKKKSHNINTGMQNYLHNEYLINIPQKVITLLYEQISQKTGNDQRVNSLPPGQSRGKTGDEQRVNSQRAEGKEFTTNNNINNNINNNSSEEASSQVKFILLNGSEFAITDDMLNEYKETYPLVDTLQIARAIRQWCRDNPKKRKTHSGARRFINSWFSSSQRNAEQEIKNNNGKTRADWKILAEQYARPGDSLDQFIARWESRDARH